jgi:hypothetical protein
VEELLVALAAVAIVSLGELVLGGGTELETIDGRTSTLRPPAGRDQKWFWERVALPGGLRRLSTADDACRNTD